jgi:sec-independent protein translocase protein TatC
MRKSNRTEIEMPFLEHLEELRWRLIKSISFLFVFSIICLIFSDQIFQSLLYTTKNLSQPINLQSLKVQTVFVIKLELSIIAGFFISLPFIFYQIWAFIAPGLRQKEKKYGFWVIISATLLFLLGAALAYFLIIPIALDFFLGLSPPSITNNIALDFYFSFVVRMIFVFGIVFELPIVSLILTKLGLINAALLRKYRRYAIVIIFIVAAILTPPDPVSQILLAIPLLILFETAILISRVFSKEG